MGKQDKKIQVWEKKYRFPADGCPARTAVLRGQRSCADSARGTSPSGLPSIAAAGRKPGFPLLFPLYTSPRNKDSGAKGQPRQIFLSMSKLRVVRRFSPASFLEVMPPNLQLGQRGKEGRVVRFDERIEHDPFDYPRGEGEALPLVRLCERECKRAAI